MKKVFRILGWTVGGLALAVGTFVGFIAVRGIPSYEPPVIAEMKVEVTPARIARGEKIAQIKCIQCHADNENRLTGKHMNDLPAMFGTIYSKNITQDKELGIGKWTDGELYHFLRTGIRHDGSFAPIMPSQPLLADEDLKSVIAWLRSDAFPVQPTHREAPASDFSLFSKFLANTVIKPMPFQTQPIALPDTNNAAVLGEYMANAVADCYACHSGDLTKLDGMQPKNSAGYYGGGIKMVGANGEEVITANLTFDKTGIAGRYTPAQFVKAVKMGVRSDGSLLRAPMFPHVTLTDKEAEAIYIFLKTVPKVNNPVPREALALAKR